MSSNTLTFRAPARLRSRIAMRVRAEQPVEERPAAAAAAAPRRSTLHEVAAQASPSVRGDLRIFALGDR